MLDKSLSIVLPVYNEKDNIRQIIDSINSYIPWLFRDFEVIIVDDGSDSATKLVLKDIQRSYKNINVITHYKNEGYGAALNTGFAGASKDWILIMDADQQFDIRQIERLIPYIYDYDVVLGQREKRSDSAYRIILGRVFVFFIYLLFKSDLKIQDLNCGFKLLKADFVKKARFISKGGMISFEIINLALKSGLKVKAAQVLHKKRKFGKPTGSSPKVIFTILKETFLLKKTFSSLGK